MIQISGDFLLVILSKGSLKFKYDHNKRLITSNMITLSGFPCICIGLRKPTSLIQKYSVECSGRQVATSQLHKCNHWSMVHFWENQIYCWIFKITFKMNHTAMKTFTNNMWQKHSSIPPHCHIYTNIVKLG